MQSEAPANCVKKTVRLAIVTTVVCEDESIYLIEPGELSVFLTGDRVEVDEGADGVALRRNHAATWVRAKRIR